MTPQRTRWPFFIALVLGVSAVAVLSYFILSDQKGEAVPASGGHYTEGVTRAPDRINPLFSSANQTDADISSLVFSGLVRLGPDGTPEPDLAERWEVTGNGQSYVFHLREGIAWQDGEPFTSDDVVFTFRAIADPNFKGDPALAQLMQGVVVTARDPLTVEFKLEQAYAPFLAYLTVGILPRHLLDGMDANQLFNAAFNTHPVGTGPYSFGTSTTTGVTLKSNSTYYLGPPKISTFEFRLFADQPSLLARAQIARHRWRAARYGVARVTSTRSHLTATYTMHTMAGSAYDIIYLDTRSPIFSDPHVRAALQQALDVQTLMTTHRDGPRRAGGFGDPRRLLGLFEGRAARVRSRGGGERAREGGLGAPEQRRSQ